MSEAIIGTIIGAVLAGAAMILNAYFSTKFHEKKEDRAQKWKQKEKDIQELNSFYEDVLHSLDRLIRNQGRGSESELEAFYKYEIRMKLISTDAIVEKFRSLKIAIGDFASKLSPYPEEFVPKFEDDDHRRERLEKRKEVETKRKNEAKKYLPDLHKQYDELSDLMKADLKLKKDI